MNTDFPMIDMWVNPNFPVTSVDPAVARLFRGLEERRRRGTTLDQLVAELDEAQVERAVLCAGYRGADNVTWVNDAIARHPERFSGSIVIDPREGMGAVRKLERAVRDDGYVMARMMGLETQLPYDNAAYFPIYAKCVELGVPVTLNVGLPGPAVVGRHQHPLAIDDVCAFFPELTIVMAHGGDPWAALCVKLMTKWPRLHYMSSAYAPRRIPSEVVAYATSSRGSDRVMWASDYPILEFARCRQEIAEMPFASDEDRHLFAYGNARRLLDGVAHATTKPELISESTGPRL